MAGALIGGVVAGPVGLIAGAKIGLAGALGGVAAGQYLYITHICVCVCMCVSSVKNQKRFPYSEEKFIHQCDYGPSLKDVLQNIISDLSN